MEIEKEIKQDKFKSEFQKLGINIIYTANWLSGHHSRNCKKHDITTEQFNILRILRGRYPDSATVNLLIDRMMNKMSNASRLVEKLRKKGLVDRRINKEDRRACDVFITEMGLELLKTLDQEEEKWVSLITHLSEEEARTANHILNKLRK